MLPVPSYHQHNYDSIPRNRQLGYSTANRCNSPSRDLVVDWQGNCFVCPCEAWLPVSVGHITEFDQLQDVWRSTTAQELQADINCGDFSHCAVDRCGVLHHSLIKNNHTVSINVDESCNLACPSCRPEARMIQPKDAEFSEKIQQVRHLVGLLETFNEPCHIVMSGNGDPLASHVMRPLIREFVPRENQTIRLFTNGLLMKKLLPDTDILNSITQYFISIDAGSAAVYEQVRQPGRWDNLTENLEWLQGTDAEVLLKFVLQADNWHDIDNFVDLCEHYNFRGVVHRLEDWGTWRDFASQDVVGNLAHPDHAPALDALSSAVNRHSPLVDFGASLRDIVQ